MRAFLFLLSHRGRCLSLFGRRSLASRDLKGVAEVIRDGAKVVVMLGAGASVSSGLPDFRSPGTGLYENLQAYGLPYPEAVFELDYFRQNPEPFYELARSLWPGSRPPTPTHLFVRLLDDKRQLVRCYTQNIDSLESAAGLSTDAVVAAHGNFDSATCIDNGRDVDASELRAALFAGNEAMRRLNARYGGLVKSDIVFFGEPLPDRFFATLQRDFLAADLLLVVGTSLRVYPFASLIDLVAPTTPRLLVNRDRVGENLPFKNTVASGFDFSENATLPRDVFYRGDADDAAFALADFIGWREDLDALVHQFSAEAAADY
ncbi:hypothetical protein CTAYLR_005814 [Chrysophaeum taylorii]|uniref:Deacetylase sirtuin-type domain-containing protein n=1 Tax=Chrysophaeum taylorii TaxID=2483200 RepID=A0AAD7ULX0_9STRA|nr:hypothetical protein CTAYLR_005814 [Chrysophaeum taylorii]